MAEDLFLNNVEHHLLSMQADDIEPLFILYSDISRNFNGIILNQILKALIRLQELGLSKCITKKGRKWQILKNITLDDLKRRIEAQSKENKNETKFQFYANDYYFKITKDGKLEESKEKYNIYYPSD